MGLTRSVTETYSNKQIDYIINKAKDQRLQTRTAWATRGSPAVY